jgi:hypothetical protein
MWVYRHTQSGALVRWGLGIGAAFALLILVPMARSGTAAALIPAIVLVALGVGVWLFGALTVEVSDERVAVWFGPGWIRKTIPIATVRAVESVRNRWYWGWGIRLTPHGWMYNVSGLDAVELSLDGGKRFRIGTDEPGRLEYAIRQVLRSRA